MEASVLCALEVSLRAVARSAGLVFSMPVLSEKAVGHLPRVALTLVLAALVVGSMETRTATWISPLALLGEAVQGAALGGAVRLLLGGLAHVVPGGLSLIGIEIEDGSCLSLMVGGLLFLGLDGDHLLIQALWALPEPGPTGPTGGILALLVRALGTGLEILWVSLLPLATVLFLIRVLVSLPGRLSGAGAGAIADALAPLSIGLSLLALHRALQAWIPALRNELAQFLGEVLL